MGKATFFRSDSSFKGAYGLANELQDSPERSWISEQRPGFKHFATSCLYLVGDRIYHIRSTAILRILFEVENPSF